MPEGNARGVAESLNARETGILRLVAKGLSDRSIASRLDLAAETVRWYNKRIYEKLGVANRTEAVSLATSSGLLSPEKRGPVERPPIQYLDNDGVSIAYQVVGQGPVDLLLIAGFVSHLEIAWEAPEYRAFVEQLSAFARVVLFDKRGIGLSDRVQSGPSLEHTVRDALAVLDATGSKRAFVFGTSEGGAAAVLLASMHPERVAGLILFGATPKVVRSDRGPEWAAPREVFEKRTEALLATWGAPWAVERFAPSRQHDQAFKDWWSKCLRAASSPSSVRAVLANAAAVDIRALLPEVETPTLVLGKAGDRIVPLAASRYLARHLPNARFVEIEGEDHVYFVKAERLVEAMASFLRDTPKDAEAETHIAIVLALSKGGPRPSAAQRAILAACQLRQLWSGQAGFVAVFDSPRGAVAAARRLRNAVTGGPLGVALHVGACGTSDGRPAKPVLAALQQLARAAAPGEIVVSSTLRDILSGSGVEVEKRGRSGRGKRSFEVFAVANP